MPMSDDRTTIRELKDLVLRFTRDRDWEQFHGPKDLGLCLSIEAGEALEHFRFRTDEEIRERLADAEHLRDLAHELADCLWALARLSDVCGIDLAAALEEKVALAASKYPIDRASGRTDKYTAYEAEDEERDADGHEGD